MDGTRDNGILNLYAISVGEISVKMGTSTANLCAPHA
jgi:hypothetical protein